MSKRRWMFSTLALLPGQEPTEDHLWIDVFPPFREGSKTERIIPFRIRIRVEVDRERRLVCTEMRLGGVPLVGDQEGADAVELTTRGLREVRINEILAELVSALARDRELKMPETQRLQREQDFAFVLGERTTHQLDSRHVGRRGHPPEFYEEVAALYRASGAIKPVKRIAEHFVVEDATARRWVRRARELGFLGKAIPGKAGEAVTLAASGGLSTSDDSKDEQP